MIEFNSMKYSTDNPFPKTFEEFLDWFPSEEACYRYLSWIRWGATPHCPKCQSSRVWLLASGKYNCECGKQWSVTAGTVFADSHKPLRLWFHIMWLLMAQKTGVSAKNFYETYGFGSYQTTWAWFQKLRSVMVRANREKLNGRIELDGTYVGGQAEGTRGRGAEKKTLVLVGVEGFPNKKLGRVRFLIVPSESSESIATFVREYVSPEATVVSDGLSAYGVVSGLVAHHEVKVQSDKSANESELEHVHLVVSLLKRWLGGTHQGAVTPGHLSGYLDEFAFRFNRRLSARRGKLFYRLMQQAVAATSPKTKDLYVHR